MVASRNGLAPPRSYPEVVALRCLIVDDNPGFLHAARALLEQEGIRVVGIASTTAEAVQRATELHPDVTLLDIDLGADSGFDLARQLVAEPRTNPGHLVVLSAYSEDEFLDLIEAQVPRRLDVHIIMDNYSTHKTALIRNWFAKRPRFHVHVTPTYGSWLSLVERWFSELTMKQIRRGTFRSVPQLKAAIQEFIAAHQADPKPFAWTKSADEILASIARFAQRTVDAHAPHVSRTSVTGH